MINLKSKQTTQVSRCRRPIRGLRQGGVAVLLALLMATGASACATESVVGPQSGLRIERAASSQYSIDHVRVRSGQHAISVSGEVARVIRRRGRIPGDVEVALIGPDGVTLAQGHSSLKRRNRQAQAARFHLRLPVDVPPGSTLIVSHQPYHNT